MVSLARTDALDRTILPVEEVLHSTPVALIGRFRCPPDHRFFPDSGPARNHIFVFPRTTVRIQREDQPPFVSTPQNLNFYNRGQAYTRNAVSPEGDHCDYFAVDPAMLVESMRAYDATAGERADQPFDTAAAPLPTEIFVQERTLADRLSARLAEDFETDEEVIWLVDAIARSLGKRGPRVKPTPRSREIVEHAKEVLAKAMDHSVSIEEIARSADASVYHLCKVFRQQTGMTMTRYRMQLRLREAFDLVPASSDLLETAMGLGFSSHAYFTHAFRAQFGMTPSEHRRRRHGQSPSHN